MDNSIQVFYDDLLDKILTDPCENSYSEFNYEFKNRTKLFDELQRYIQDSSYQFYESFIKRNALYNIQIKKFDFIECYVKSVPSSRGRYVDRYVTKFTVLYVKKI